MDDRICVIEDCGRPARRRGLCSRHHARVLTTGELGGPIRPVGRAADQWITRISVESPGCWLWQGNRNADGYGLYRTVLKERSQLAHRFVYEALVGQVPPGLELDHLCRVRHCVNPDHLEPVTHLENVRRGAGNYPRSHCRRGHQMTAENTRIHVDKIGTVRRKCRACCREDMRRYRAEAA